MLGASDCYWDRRLNNRLTGRQKLHTVALLLILLISFALRVYLLDGQSLWSDEGASAVMAGRDVGQILDAAAGDIHPPLYYILLHWWSTFAGTGEFGLRFISLILGVVMVALTFKLGERFFGASAGLIAAFIAGVSPFLIYYSQEARMYMPMATFALLSVYLFSRLLEDSLAQSTSNVRSRYLPSLAYVIATAASLYMQYFAFSILLFQNIAFIISRWRIWENWLAWARWFAMQAVVVLLYIPWLLKAGRQLSAWPSVSQPLSLSELLHQVFLVFSFGLSWDATATAKTELLFLFLLASSLLWLFIAGNYRVAASEKLPSSNRYQGYLLSVGFLLVPVFIMYLLSIQRPMYKPKFLLLAAPPYYLLIALGIVSLYTAIIARFWSRSVKAFGRWMPGILNIALVALSLLGIGYACNRSLAAYYWNPKYARDDYRGLAKYIERSSKQGDAIILNAPGQMEIFDYYYRGDSECYPLPKQRPINENITAGDLEDLVSRHSRVWMVLWAVDESDPHRFIQSWLSQRTFKTYSRWYGDVQLELYDVATSDPDSIGAGTLEKELDVSFGDNIQLVSYRIEPATLASGDTAQLTLLWQPLAAIDKHLTVFAHIIDSHQYIWGQHDSEPAGGVKPTTSWQPGETVSDRHGLAVMLGTPSGEYQIEVGLYDSASGARLPVIDKAGRATDDRVLLGSLKIRKPEPFPLAESVLAQNPTTVHFDALQLLGFDLTKQGSSQPTTHFSRGDIAHVTLYWQALQKHEEDYTITLQVRNQEGAILIKQARAPAEENYPTSGWEKGEIVRDQWRLNLNVPPGSYRLYLGVERKGITVEPKASKLPVKDRFISLTMISME